MRLLLAALVLGVLSAQSSIALAASAGKEFRWQVMSAARDRVIETQTVDYGNPVVNSTECIWDIDDNLSFVGTGNIGPRQTVSFERCLIADNAYHLWGMAVGTPRRADYRATLSFSTGHTIELSNRGCMVGPIYDLVFSGLQPIPDSNGGVGKLVTVTWSITNLNKQTLHNVMVSGKLYFSTAEVIQTWCPGASTSGDLDCVYDPNVCWATDM